LNSLGLAMPQRCPRPARPSRRGRASTYITEPRIPSGTSEGGSGLRPSVALEPATRTDVVHEGHGVAIGLRKPADEVAGGERLHPVEPRGSAVELPGVVEGPFLE